MSACYFFASDGPLPLCDWLGANMLQRNVQRRPPIRLRPDAARGSLDLIGELDDALDSLIVVEKRHVHRENLLVADIEWLLEQHCRCLVVEGGPKPMDRRFREEIYTVVNDLSL